MTTALSIQAEMERLRTALDEAVALLEEVYAHLGADGKHLKGPEIKIWVHRSTIDTLGDRLVSLRDSLQD